MIKLSLQVGKNFKFTAEASALMVILLIQLLA